MAMMKRGDYVQTITGVFGLVVKAGSATYTVEWESGNTNRVSQGYRDVKLVTDPKLLELARVKCAAR